MQGRTAVPRNNSRNSTNKWQTGTSRQTSQLPSSLAPSLEACSTEASRLPGHWVLTAHSDNLQWTMPSLTWLRSASGGTQLRQLTTRYGLFINLKLVTFTLALNPGVRRLISLAKRWSSMKSVLGSPKRKCLLSYIIALYNYFLYLFYFLNYFVQV